jgi:N utilization substance protein A
LFYLWREKNQRKLWRDILGIDMSEAIRQLSQERGLSEELIQKTIENMLLAAYRKRYGTDENAIIRIDDDGQVTILSK